MSIPTDPLYPFFTIFSFFSFLLPLIPLTWHLQAWNAGTILDFAPAWCDFSSHVLLAGNFAIPLCSLCVVRRLYLVVSAQSALTRIERRRAVILDTTLCLIIPLVLTALQYIVQGHRYCIIEEIGCMPYTYPTVAASFLINLLPVLTGVVAAYYDIRCIIALCQRYHELRNLPDSTSEDSYTMDRFIPVVVFVLVETCTTPIAIFPLIMNIRMGFLP
ncbi:pheromone A receptor-domain-containing protein [Lentinula aciculospora]|uniref:Pheromone A receptor-domain-containing protein n=1 Tax=Lentinula aciculospora TaxID=153920 RepID=A0A9W9A5Q3_9AGAR|nr:pheromone A receptor-domain-containing protein [Lentinula aciculospora]